MKKTDQLSKLAGFISGLLRCETSLSGADLRGHDRAVCDLCGALPDFLNAEDDDMGFLVNMDTGERITWGGELV